MLACSCMVATWRWWVQVCDVWFLEPQSKLPGESVDEFAGRVQRMIADAAGEAGGCMLRCAACTAAPRVSACIARHMAVWVLLWQGAVCRAQP